ncbi:MAG TPA: DinB family protein [Methylomirabilota bacterium]|nr:DinB family protein [Methylomirabilota bacterium]
MAAEPETWSVRDVVHHLEDAELTGAVRLRRLLTEDAPVLPAFDEEVYRERLGYAARPIEPALDAIRAAHATTAELLERLTGDDWARAGTHSEDGPYPPGRWLAFHAAHTHEHARQIRQLRLARAGGVPPPAAPSGARWPLPATR